MYKIWIQYTNLFKRYRTETSFQCWKRAISHNNWWILPLIELDLYFMIIYLCLKVESNILIFSKDIERKPFLLRTGRADGWMGRTDRMARTDRMSRTDVWTAVILYAPHWKWRGVKPDCWKPNSQCVYCLLYLYLLYFLFIISQNACLIKLEFYGPVNTVKKCRANQLT